MEDSIAHRNDTVKHSLDGLETNLANLNCYLN